MLNRSTLSDVVRYAQLTIDECTQFFVRGACRISGNFAIFCKIFAQNLRDLDAGLARYLALERTSTRKRAATKVCGSCNHAGRIYATFLRAACRKFSETLQFFRASWAQKLCVPDAGRLFFFGSDCNADSVNAQRRCEVCTAHDRRVHAIFCARGVPDFRKFCNFLQDFCANF